MEIEMKIKGLVIDPISKMPIVVLEDRNGEQSSPSGSEFSRPTPSP